MNNEPDAIPRETGAEAWRTLLQPLARAQDALARLEATAAAVSPDVREGLRARLAYREAAGWLAHHGHWIHPVDLALRDAGLTGSYTAARLGARLPSVLPVTTRDAEAGEGEADVPEDQDVALALTVARLWRRLAELRTWQPLESAEALAAALAPLGGAAGSFAALQDLLATADLPPLLVAGIVVRDWSVGRAGQGERRDRLAAPGILVAACIWRAQDGRGDPGLPVWSAPVQRLHRLALQPRALWLPGFLDCVAEAAGLAARELARLRQAEARAATLERTARSRLPQAAALALRHPVISARLLADRLRISHRAGLDLTRQMVDARLIREATGRESWRAFVVV
ncbi:helix-turn-helix domain-containing protein [Limobrevibacterium gyesilva]|uniref:Helix-turn-helix domain-containing protein n=1 Tax=Limobrevibacterium gyesilva TaxID=2991712 RepID=A0AA41YQK5_9PROT|nr:helix-turn-helix domain-containing protein [Limobrevibacterium gyesilva]MCW3476906.1 helix-turn-helix domain-containing protein [Limobrevibacterium gyesilva]